MTMYTPLLIISWVSTRLGLFQSNVLHCALPFLLAFMLVFERVALLFGAFGRETNELPFTL
jgi:hypothetical protein